MYKILVTTVTRTFENSQVPATVNVYVVELESLKTADDAVYRINKQLDNVVFVQTAVKLY